MFVLLGVDGRERGVLNGVREGEDSGRVLGEFVALLETFLFTFPFPNPSLCGGVASITDASTESFDSTDGIGISGSRSIVSCNVRWKPF